MRALRNERGQTAAEYVGIILVVAAIIAVIGASGIAEALTARIQQSIAEMATGQGGEAGGGGPGGSQPGGGGSGPGGSGGPGGSQPAVARPAPAPAAEGADDEPSALERLGGGLADFAGGATDLAGDAAGGVSGFVADNAGGALDTLVSGAQGAGALLDGLLLGDIHGSGYENPWLESLRAVGHTASGIVVLGDVRDSLFNLGKVIVTGGQEGKADLGLSLFGIVPYFGDVAKGAKLADGVADAFRAADKAREGSRTADGARAAEPPPARPRPGCPRSSFTARTPVLMAGGHSKPIAEVRVGERVIATDPQTGETGARAVERLIHSEGQKTLVRVRVSGEVLTATDRHPVWVESRRAWRDAAELRPGDVLREPDGERTAVESVRVMAPEPERVHNLTVAGLHTYYAGKAPVLVHNAGCVPEPPKPKNGGDYRPFTEGNYRSNLIARTGRNPGAAEQAHHVFPQKFVDRFERAGINIHQPNLMVWWERGAHSRASTPYNKEWEDFFIDNPNPTDGQVLDFGRRQAEDYGLEQPF